MDDIAFFTQYFLLNLILCFQFWTKDIAVYTYNYKILSTREEQKENNRKTTINISSDFPNYLFEKDQRNHWIFYMYYT